MATHFSIAAEYAHTMIGRQAFIGTDGGKIRYTIQSVTLDPDANHIVIRVTTPWADLPIRLGPSDLLQIEHEGTAL